MSFRADINANKFTSPLLFLPLTLIQKSEATTVWFQSVIRIFGWMASGGAVLRQRRWQLAVWRMTPPKTVWDLLRPS